VLLLRKRVQHSSLLKNARAAPFGVGERLEMHIYSRVNSAFYSAHPGASPYGPACGCLKSFRTISSPASAGALFTKLLGSLRFWTNRRRNVMRGAGKHEATWSPDND
jgi:hypothetical protein